MSQTLPQPLRETLIEVEERRAHIQRGFYYAIEIGQARSKTTLNIAPDILAKRLRDAADRLDGLARQRCH